MSWIRHLVLILLPANLSVAHADAGRASSACAPLLAQSKVLQSIAYERQDDDSYQWLTAYLNLLNIVLAGIDEISADAFGNMDHAQVKVQLLNWLSSSSVAISPIKELQTFTNFSTKLSTLADSGQIEVVIENLRPEEWDLIRKALQQKLVELGIIKNAQDIARPATYDDFLDEPGFNGEVRLHQLMREGTIEEIERFIGNPRITPNYLNTISSLYQTPLDIFVVRFITSAPKTLKRLRDMGARFYRELGDYIPSKNFFSKNYSQILPAFKNKNLFLNIQDKPPLKNNLSTLFIESTTNLENFENLKAFLKHEQIKERP